jgi:organic radical activating enzyme
MRINEIFYSIQGEGMNAGRPASFIRLQGCSVGCVWCDTKNSWDEKLGTEFTVNEIIDQLESDFIIITGGEPAEQNLHELAHALRQMGKEIAIETSGTRIISEKFDWMTVSPKSFKREILPLNLRLADELKFVYTDSSSEPFIFSCIAKAGKKPVFIQPNGLSKKSTREAIEFCKKHNFRLSLQMHKYVGIQ